MRTRDRPVAKTLVPTKLAFNIVLPTEPTYAAYSPRDYVMMAYGPPGAGKTTFFNEMHDGRVLFLSTDRGTRHLKTQRIEFASWAELEAILKKLQEKPDFVRQHYDAVCIDHVDDMALMAEVEICRKLGVDGLGDAGFGKGWKAYRLAIMSVVQRIMGMGVGMNFIAHEETKTIKTRVGEYDRTTPAMPKSAWKVIIPLADLIGYCGYSVVKKGGGVVEEVRTLRTQPTEAIYAKDRTRRTKPAAGKVETLDGKRFMSTFEIDPTAETAEVQTPEEELTDADESPEASATHSRHPSSPSSNGPGRRRRARNAGPTAGPGSQAVGTADDDL